MRNYNWQEIEKASMRSPIVHAFTYAHRYVPGVTREQALIGMVVELEEVLNATQALLSDRLTQERPVIKIVSETLEAGVQAERHRIYAALEADPSALWRDQGFQEWRQRREVS